MTEQDALPGLTVWLRRLKLRHLVVLVAISRHGSLTAAAVALHMSQPAVSKWLSDIEASIGVALFVRGRRLRPTPYAEALLLHAERMLSEARHMHASLQAVHQGGSGLVRIGAMGVAAPVLLPLMVAHLHRQSPRLRIVIIEDIAVGLQARFARNELDVLVGLLDEAGAVEGIASEALHAEPYCVIAARQHPLTRRRRPQWRDTVGYPWVLPPAATPLRRAVDATFLAAGLEAPQPLLESVSFTTNLVFLRQGIHLGVASQSAARYYQSLGVLKALPLDIQHGIGPVRMIWRSADALPGVVSVLDALRAASRDGADGSVLSAT